MNVTVRLFAAARELAGQGEVVVELPAGATIAQLRQVLQEKYPPLAPLLPHALFAVDAEYVSDAATVPEDSEIACIPPVSGG